jgi:hypothetical protein
MAANVTLATVYMERRNRLDPSLLPAVVVSLTDSEPQTDDFTMRTPFVSDDQQAINVEIQVAGMPGDDGLGVAEAIDAIEVQVETAIAEDPSLGGAVEIVYPGGSVYETSVDQDRVLGVRVIQYLAPWRHTFGSPDQPEG